MGVLTDKLTALVASANETTGESDTKLTDAVGHLIDGYGGGSSETWYEAEDLTFNGTSSTLIDTGVQVFDSAKSFHIFCAATPAVDVSGMTLIMHGTYEASPYNGISFEFASNGYPSARIKVPPSFAESNAKVSAQATAGVPIRFALSYDCDAGFAIAAINTNGTTKIAWSSSQQVISSSLTKTLLLGGYTSTSGSTGRYYNGTISEIKVLSGSIKAIDCLNYVNQEG